MQPQHHTFTISPLQRLFIIVVSVVGVLGLGFVTVQALTFHIVKTDPKLSAVGNYSPFIKIYFNNNLNPATVKIAGTANVIKSTQVNGKILTVDFNSPLVIDRDYTITLQHIENTKGKVISGKTLHFTAKDIAISDLSSDQQKAIVQNQDKYPYSVYSLPFRNFDALTNNGLTSDQEQIVKQAIYDYSVSVNQQFKSVNLDASSVNQEPVDPNSADLSRTLDFNFTANGSKYSTSVTYNDLTSAHVIIKDVVGTTVYDNTTH